MLTTPGWAPGLRFVARDSNATKRPLAETAIPGPESPSATGASAPPRLTSATSPTAARATSGVSATISTAAIADARTERPARPALMLSRIDLLGVARAASAAGLRHADTDPTALERDRRVFRTGAGGVDHVHEALGLLLAQ